VAVSQNLLTKPSTVDGTELALQDRASPEAVTAWMSDTRFAQLQETMRQCEQRIQRLALRQGRIILWPLCHDLDQRASMRFHQPS
jgi:hypothetical protein